MSRPMSARARLASPALPTPRHQDGGDGAGVAATGTSRAIVNELPDYHTSNEEEVSYIDEDEDEEDDIDLDSYEAYLAEIKRKADLRPQSARALRPYPSESPQFYMVNATNPVAPIHTSAAADLGGPTRPGARPMSARPRLANSSTATQLLTPRAPQTAKPPSVAGAGMRRKRQGEMAGVSTGAGGDNAVSARIRAVYSDVGRTAPSPSSAKHHPMASASHTATSVLHQSRLSGAFQQAELQHERDRLADVIADLRVVVQHEQTQRLKAMARVRRLEEIVSMKDKKIESLLAASQMMASSSSFSFGDLHNHNGGGGGSGGLQQREVAHKERLHHAVMQKLRHKLAQQSQLLAAYEESMHAIRSSVKSTNVMEMEEAYAQLCVENTRLTAMLTSQQAELDRQRSLVADVTARDAHWQSQVVWFQNELRNRSHENTKLEQDIFCLRVTAEQLEQKLAREHKKRAYDQVVATASSSSPSPSPRGRTNVTANKSPQRGGGGGGSVPSLSCSSLPGGNNASSLAEALAEMKTLRAENKAAIVPTTPPTSTSTAPNRGRRPTPMHRAIDSPPLEEGGEESCSSSSPVIPRMSTGTLTEEITGGLVEGIMTVKGPTSLMKKADTPRGKEGVEKKHVRWRTEVEAEGENEEGGDSDALLDAAEQPKEREDPKTPLKNMEDEDSDGGGVVRIQHVSVEQVTKKDEDRSLSSGGAREEEKHDTELEEGLILPSKNSNQPVGEDRDEEDREEENVEEEEEGEEEAKGGEGAVEEEQEDEEEHGDKNPVPPVRLRPKEHEVHYDDDFVENMENE